MAARATAVLAALLAGCTAASPAPPSARRTIREAQRSPHGAWINIVTVEGEVAGELLAVEPRALVVASTAGFRRVPVAGVRRWTLAWYEAQNDGVLAMVALGTASTLSHGFWLIFTAPLLWWAPGIAMSRAQSAQGYEEGGPDPVAHLALRRYARFPAGLPPGFEPALSPPGGAP